MKLYRNAIILLVVLAIIIGVYYVVKINRPDEFSGPTTANTISLWEDFTIDDIDTIQIENNGRKYVVTRIQKEQTTEEGTTTTEEWGLTYPENFKYDKYKSKAIALNLEDLKANKIIEEDASDLSKYGLDNPVVVTVNLKDGKKHVLEFGNKTVTGENFYAKVKDKNTVYTISNYFGRNMVFEPTYIRSTSILDIDSDSIIAFTMWRNGELAFDTRAPEEGSENRSEGNYWSLTYPVEANVDFEAIIPMTQTASVLTAAEVVEIGAQDLSKYGLDNPSYAYELKTADKSYKVLLGNLRNEGSQIYAKLEDSNEVFAVNFNTLNFIDKPIDDIVDIYVYMEYIGSVEKIEVEMDGHKDLFEIVPDPNGNTKNDKFYVNGKEVTAVDELGNNLFREYYSQLIGIQTKDVDLKTQPTGEPEITFTYYLKIEPGVVKIEFIPRDEYYYYVRKNGKYSGVLVQKKEFDKAGGVREVYRVLMASLGK